jgi:hypothetical protein
MSVTTRRNVSDVQAATDRRTRAISALASSSLMADVSCSYGSVGRPLSMSATRRRSITAGTVPRAATQSTCAQPVCSATLMTHGARFMSSSPDLLYAQILERTSMSLRHGCPESRAEDRLSGMQFDYSPARTTR